MMVPCPSHHTKPGEEGSYLTYEPPKVSELLLPLRGIECSIPPSVQIIGNVIMAECCRVYADLVHIQFGHFPPWATTLSF